MGPPPPRFTMTGSESICLPSPDTADKVYCVMHSLRFLSLICSLLPLATICAVDAFPLEGRDGDVWIGVRARTRRCPEVVMRVHR